MDTNTNPQGSGQGTTATGFEKNASQLARVGPRMAGIEYDDYNNVLSYSLPGEAIPKEHFATVEDFATYCGRRAEVWQQWPKTIHLDVASTEEARLRTSASKWNEISWRERPSIGNLHPPLLPEPTGCNFINNQP